jgi:hypothetical protein
VSTVYEIPLSPVQQTLSVSLAGVTFQFTFVWVATAPTTMPVSATASTDGFWAMNIADAQGNPLLNGAPLVTGANLLDQYRYLGIPGALVVQTDNDPAAIPTFTNLGNEAHLYWVSPA